MGSSAIFGRAADAQPRAPASERDVRPRAAGGDARHEELALQAQAGSAEAFGHLVQRFQKSLYGFLLVRTRCREDAEELTQETFVRAWCKLDRYRTDWKFSTWLFTLARRLAASHRRARAAKPDAQCLVDHASGDADPFGDACASEERALLWHTAARVLSDDQRTALWLRYAEGLSVAEIASVLGRLRTTVRVLLFRARETLARELDGEARSRALRRAGDATRPRSNEGDAKR